MASIGKDPGGYRRILFMAPDGKRKTVCPGKVARRQAESVKVHIENLVSGLRTRSAPPTETADWLARLDAAMYGKLARVGLVANREAVEMVALGDFVGSYIGDRAGVEAATKEIWGRAKKNLVEFFGADKALGAITLGDAVEFWNWLISETGGKLMESTARKRYSHACMFFLHAARKELVLRQALILG